MGGVPKEKGAKAGLSLMRSGCEYQRCGMNSRALVYTFSPEGCGRLADSFVRKWNKGKETYFVQSRTGDTTLSCFPVCKHLQFRCRRVA